jgi:hypothetical protein
MQALKQKAKLAGVRVTKDVKKGDGTVKRVDKTAEQLRADVAKKGSSGVSSKIRKQIRGGNGGEVAAPPSPADCFATYVSNHVRERGGRPGKLEMTRTSQVGIQKDDGSVTMHELRPPAGGVFVQYKGTSGTDAFPLPPGAYNVGHGMTVVLASVEPTIRTDAYGPDSSSGFVCDVVFLTPTDRIIAEYSNGVRGGGARRRHVKK